MSIFDYPALPPEEGAELFAEDPSACLFPLRNFPEQFGVDGPSLLEELRAGRLVAVMPSNADPIPANAAVAGDALIEWLTCGSPCATRAFAFIQGRRTRH